MSRVGLKPIPVPSGVDIKIKPGLSVVKGPKGEVRQHLPEGIDIKVQDGEIRCTRDNDRPEIRSRHGLIRALLSNQIQGVTEGFQKTLTIIGVGYRAEAKGKSVTLSLGYSHPIEFPIPKDVEIVTPEATKVVITGIDKQRVGQVAAEIRRMRPPEPYKGKGVRYEDEQVRRKAGKAAAKS